MDFVEWLEEQMQQRGWTPADLAKAAGMYPSTLSRVLNRERAAGAEVCNALARALGIAPAMVFQRAGLMDRSPLEGVEQDTVLSQLLTLARQLTPAERRRLANVAELYLREQQTRYEPATGAAAPDDAGKVEP
jgi:transcriptional regulator with XRE-family HTH domain